jgi:hypothetical protein
MDIKLYDSSQSVGGGSTIDNAGTNAIYLPNPLTMSKSISKAGYYYV